MALPIQHEPGAWVLGHSPSRPHTALCSGGLRSHFSTSQTRKGTLGQREGQSRGKRGPKAHLVPVQPLQVHQDPHQLRDGQGRVGVIQLDGHLWRGVWGSVWEPHLGYDLCALSPQRPPLKGPHGPRAELGVEALRGAAVGRRRGTVLRLWCPSIEDPGQGTLSLYSLTYKVSGAG